MRGHLWFIRKFGVRRWWRYLEARHNGVEIDYAEIFDDRERAILGEHFEVPWERKST